MVTIASIIATFLGPNITKIRPDCPLKNPVGYYAARNGTEKYFQNSHKSGAISELEQNTYFQANSTMGLFPSLLYGLCKEELTMDAIGNSEHALPFVFDLEHPIYSKDSKLTIIEVINHLRSRGDILRIKQNQNSQIEQCIPENKSTDCYDAGIIYIGKNPCNGSNIIANFAVSPFLRGDQHEILSSDGGSVVKNRELYDALFKIVEILGMEKYSAAEIITCKQKGTHSLVPYAIAYI